MSKTKTTAEVLRIQGRSLLALADAIESETEAGATKPVQEDPLMTRSDVAAYLQVSNASVDRYQIPYIQVVGQRRYRRSAVDAWLQQRGKEAPKVAGARLLSKTGS